MSNDSIKIAIVGAISDRERSNIIEHVAEKTHKYVIVVDSVNDADMVLTEEKTTTFPIVNTHFPDAICERIAIDQPSKRNLFLERKEQRIKSEILYRSKFKK